jgi:hypothetical protein
VSSHQQDAYAIARGLSELNQNGFLDRYFDPPLAEITGLVDAFCKEHLNAEYADLCRKLTEKLARKRPSPLVSGNADLGLWHRSHHWLGELP